VSPFFDSRCTSVFFLSLSLVTHFSLAQCTRLDWHFSVSFQVHVKSSLSYRIVLCVVDAVSAFWQNHSSEFSSLSLLQACISDVRRRLTLRSSADMVETSTAGEQRDNSSTCSDDVN